MPKGYPVSASAVKKYEDCPKQYQLKYILRKPATKAKKGYGQLGSLVHKAIENVLEADPDLRDEPALRSRLKQEFFALEDSDDVETDAVTDKQRSDGLSCLEVAARYLAKQTFEIRELELKIEYHIDVPDVDRNVIGYVDVCTDEGIIDWKTGRIRETTARDEIIQGAIYMGGYFNEYGTLPNSIRFVYLKEKEEREITPGQETWQTMLRYMRKLIDGEKTGVFVAKPDDSKCHFCDYAYWCDAASTSPGQISAALEDNPDLLDAV